MPIRYTSVMLAAVAAAGAQFLAASLSSAAIIPLQTGDTNINSTNSAGTVDTGNVGPESGENSNRDENLMLLAGDLTATGPGGTLEQPQNQANGHYYNNAGSVNGDLGLLIDLGNTYTLQALQLYGYNITDGGTTFHGRSLGSFTIKTATDPAAVSTAGGKLLVADASKFTQQGGTQTMAGVASSSTPGESYLFGGLSQPSEVSGTTHTVTGSSVNARYILLGGMTAQNSGDVVGIGQIAAFGTAVPEPTTISLLGLGAAVGVMRRRRA